jgi:hypothetical protein
VQCVRARCRGQADGSTRLQFPFHSHRSLSQPVQGWFTLTPGGTNSLWLHGDNRKKMITLSWFFICSCELSSVLETGGCRSSFCLLVPGSYSENQLSSPVMPRLRKSVSVSIRSSISTDTSFQRTFWSSFKFLRTIFAHAIPVFRSCATAWWTLHSSILSSSAIIRIVKRPSWRMVALTRSRFVPVLMETGCPDRRSYRPFKVSLCHRNIWARYETLCEAFRTCR